MEHPLLAALRAMVGPVKDATQGNAWSMSDTEITVGLGEVAAMKSMLAAVETALVGEADTRNLGVAGATTTAGWLRSTMRVSPTTARHTVSLARAARSVCAATGAALTAARVNIEQAQVIVGVMGDLPRVGAVLAAAAEDFMIGAASMVDPIELRKAGRHLCETLTTKPDPEERARRQTERRYLHLIPAYDGMTVLRGLLDAESAAILAAALDPLSAPEPADDGTPDQRTAAQRRADDMTRLARIGLASGDLPASGGIKPTLVVTIDHGALTGQIAAAGLLPGGQALSASACRRIGCDARVIPVVLGGTSQPLDVGRSRRSIPEPMRAALVIRDQACAFPGCDRPPAWTSGHHIRHWSHGGPTALHNLVLLCRTHHQAVHDHGWQVALDEGGLPFFRPPAWVDRDRRPRQHHRYRLRQLVPDPGSGPYPPGSRGW